MKINNRFLLLSVLGFQLSAFSFAQETAPLSRQERLKKANQHFSAGNKLLSSGDYAGADSQFKKAQELLNAGPPEPSPEKSASEKPAPEKPVPVSPPAKAKPKKDKPELNIPKDMSAEEAAAFYRRASKLLPRAPNLHYNLGVAYLQTKQYPLAAEAFKKALRLNPKDKEAYYNLAVLCENHLGDKKQALFYYGRYLKLPPLAEDSQKVKSWMRQIKEELKLNE